MEQPQQPDLTLLRPRDAYWQTAQYMRTSLPRPAINSPDDIARRDCAAIAKACHRACPGGGVAVAWPAAPRRRAPGRALGPARAASGACPQRRPLATHAGVRTGAAVVSLMGWPRVSCIVQRDDHDTRSAALSLSSYQEEARRSPALLTRSGATAVSLMGWPAVSPSVHRDDHDITIGSPASIVIPGGRPGIHVFRAPREG
jgi:hypothetical protein